MNGRAGRRRLAAPVLLLLALALAGCREKAPSGPSAEELAYQFRDVYPYPAVTGGGSPEEAAMLRPLRDAYLTYIERVDFNAAAAQFAEVAEKHPDLTEARLLQGISLVLAERPGEAIQVLTPVVEQYPGYPVSRWFLGQALFSAGRHEEALEQMREVRAIGGEYSEKAAQVLATHDGGG